MEIEVGKIGKIVAGQEQGCYVKVIDDEVNTGGFLILTATAPDMLAGFDSWVEDRETLQRFFEEAEWLIEWERD
ncbi:hypothetical protein AGMMS50225_04760 [Betaproteobacteria bacterium]|nr:hypothetical protein AGMMS50225_04760 [Betaproteobacteria bacterium]